MASQGERELGVLGMDAGLLESMVQDGNLEQEMLVVQDELPQLNPEPEMGAAAVAADDTPPPHLRQIPSPTPSEIATDNGGSVQLSPTARAQMVEMFKQAMSGDMQRMNNRMKANTNEIKNGMKEEIKKMRGEMRQMGQCLQAGKMATPRAGTSELGGSATAVRPAVEAGEDRVIRETCWETISPVESAILHRGIIGSGF